MSDQSALFLVLDAEGRLLSSLGSGSSDLSPAAIPMAEVAHRFPQQVAGYLQQGTDLFYVVLTPVYVQASGGPLLLNVLCAGFRIDGQVTAELKRLVPGNEFAFLNDNQVFASTLSGSLTRQLSAASNSRSPSSQQQSLRDQFVMFRQPLEDVRGRPVAELRILHSYEQVRSSLASLRRVLGLAWIATVAAALLLSSYATRRLLAPLKLLDSRRHRGSRWKLQLPCSGQRNRRILAAGRHIQQHVRVHRTSPHRRHSAGADSHHRKARKLACARSEKPSSGHLWRSRNAGRRALAGRARSKDRDQHS